MGALPLRPPTKPTTQTLDRHGPPSMISLFQGCKECQMLAKLTAKNQLTLPKAIVSHFPGVGYFDVSEESGRIVLAPIRVNQADAVRAKLAELGIEDSDVRDAVRWARENR